jgi:hypothetical protein
MTKKEQLNEIKKLKNEIDRLNEVIIKGLIPIKIESLPFSVHVALSTWLNESWLYLPPKDFATFAKKFKEKLNER